MGRDKQPTVGPSIAEARALVDSLGSWRTIGTASFSLRGIVQFNRERFFTKGVWEEVTKTVELYRTGRQNVEQSDDDAETENPRATAVFINWSRLSTLQINAMQRAWALPIFDRYSLVVQLFNLRAKSQEAKLQAQLAELGLLRARLPALFSFTPSDNKNINTITGASLHHMDQLLKERETRILDQLTAVEQRRQATRQHRREKQTHQFPIVTVVGYTNAGKTSLIRCLTGNQKLSSSPQVFATLDITHHRARLPAFHKHYLNAPPDVNVPAGSEHLSKFGLPGIHLLILDTIGFMADLPTNLIAAFRATLEECLDTDLILHVIDISEPDWERRAFHVDSVLTRAGVRLQLNTTLSPQPHFERDRTDKSNSPTILRVGNKVDCGLTYVTEANRQELDFVVSTENRTGIPELCKGIEDELSKYLGWLRHTVCINQGSPVLEWLYSNAMVTDISVAPEDAQRLYVSAIFTQASWNRLKHQFRVVSSKRL
ncbi:hypothetical protein EG68_02244 [Paragonimus skrjabini miyazakii]|uniref:Hflx-type G domain-containing protein n=1 Tax=Paragonimus skrjabini miyazakii TaxID=59628 RepID=A0A8S9Z4U5_9TREM|nr:hypothetical protein EG68_02244 [Paragonimus skrjabini miyazakii]